MRPWAPEKRQGTFPGPGRQREERGDLRKERSQKESPHGALMGTEQATQNGMETERRILKSVYEGIVA